MSGKADNLPTVVTTQAAEKQTLRVRTVKAASNLLLSMFGGVGLFGTAGPGVYGYDGGLRREMGPWGDKIYGPDMELLFYVRDLNRIRQQIAENPTALRARNYRSTALIADQGFIPRLDPWPEIKERWIAWSESTECDAMGERTLLGLQKQWANAIVGDGDVLCRIRERDPDIGEDKALTPNSGTGIQLQLMEIDHLQIGRNMVEADGTVSIDGVNRNPRNNQILGYYLYRRHPQSWISIPLVPNNLPVWVPASQILRGRHIDRIGSTRSAPPYKTILPRIRAKDEYVEAEIDRKKVSARRAFIVKMPGLPNDKDVLMALVGARQDVSVDGSTADGDTVISLPENGEMLALPPGWDMSPADPADVGGGFLPFMQVVGQEIAIGTGQPYYAITGDTNNINDRMGRMIDIAQNKDVNFDREEYIIRPLMRPVFKRWLNRLFFVDEILDPNKYDLAAIYNVDFSYPKEAYVNRYQEEQANDLRLKNKITTATRIIESEGEDPAKLTIERAMEASTERVLASPEFAKEVDAVVIARLKEMLGKVS